jgi:outer membrane receptor protein involved in Fe transport
MRIQWIGVSALALTACLSAHDRAAAEAADPPKPQAVDTASGGNTIAEVVITANKRAETLQSVPASIEVLDSHTLKQLQVNDFQDYAKYVPSLAFQTLGPNQTSVYLRGVSSGDNANHSGPLPTVGVYFDELPITTIGGTLDINMYDTARVEVLPGPQGTLYGASSESGTLRIISNPPSTAGLAAGYSAEVNTVKGAVGSNFEGFVNVPLGGNAAIRIVGWDEHSAGYIDNVLATRTFTTSGDTINNAPYVKNNENPSSTVGGRAALLYQLNPDWSVLASVVGQDQHITGVYGYFPSVGDLDVERFSPDTDHDQWVQAGLTVTGKMGNYELTYAGGFFARHIYQKQDYADYAVFYDAVYGSGAFWQNAAGAPLQDPEQTNLNNYHYYKYDNELRLASPSTDRLRFVVGLFQEIQQHYIIQDQSFIQEAPGAANTFSPTLSVPGWPGTLWLTDQLRKDRDYAAYTEVTFDVTKHLSILAGVRPYHYNNTLYGFFGYSAAYDALSGFGAGEGVDDVNCIPGKSFLTAPCVNLNKASTGSGETHKVNLTYKFDADHLVYFTYSTGYRPGGVNRNGAFAPYGADALINYELGFKTSWLDRSLVWNTAIYDEDWNNFQFSFLGPNDLTVIENAPEASVKGLETALEWRATSQLSLNLGATLTDAKLTRNFCGTDQATGQIIQSCANAAAVATSGTPLPYTPDFKGYATLRYTFQVFDWNGFAQASGTYQSVNHVGLRVTDIEELGSMPAYGTLDLSAGATRGKLSLEVFIKNATDSRGQENRYTTCPVGVCSQTIPGAPNSIYVVPIVPLTVGLKVSQNF